MTQEKETPAEEQASDLSTPAVEPITSDAEAPTAAEEPAAPAPAAPAFSGLELYFLRHADAGDPAEWPGDDADRPLSAKGRKQARRLGKLLKRLALQPDTVVTSPKLRAADTARLVAKRIGIRVQNDARLGGGLEADALAALVGELDGASRIFLVGHDPDFSDLASWLSGFPVSLRKGALARIDVPDRAISAGRGSLRWLLPPDAVPG